VAFGAVLVVIGLGICGEGGRSEGGQGGGQSEFGDHFHNLVHSSQVYVINSKEIAQGVSTFIVRSLRDFASDQNRYR
jgi:hypothetical protein